MTDNDNKTPIEEAKWQVENFCCEGSHHNHDLIVGLLAEIERLQAESNNRVTRLLAQIVALRIVIERLRAYRTAADAYLMGLNDHLHGNLRSDLTVLRANWDAARAALERKTPEEILSP